MRIGTLALLAVVSLSLCGCYTRLTTPKEAREWRATYPELEANESIMLPNKRGYRDNTFVMTVETYIDLMDRYRLYDTDGVAPGGGEPLRFRPGSVVDIKLPNHPDDPINEESYRVRPEGTIDVGPLSDFPAAGKTARQLRVELSRALSNWYRSTQENGDGPLVSVNLPVIANNLTGDFTPWGEVNVFALDTRDSGGGGASSSGPVSLRGDDTVLSVVAESYSSSLDWHEVAVRRRIQTDRKDPETGRYFEYVIIIIVDLEKVIYDDPNLDIHVRDGDMVILHAEKNPLIVEILETAAVITGAWGNFTGVEGVLEDIFKRNF